MKGERTFDKLSFLSDEQAWVRALDYAVHVESAVTFKKRLETWLPYFPDAAAAIEKLIKAGYPEWDDFVRGFEAERDKRFSSAEWADKYAVILMPRNAIHATLLSRRFQAPWGATLIRIAEASA